MKNTEQKVTVYYDGSCPRCIQDRNHYRKLSGEQGASVCWVDITGREKQLQQLGIDPVKALTELHVKTASGKIVSELDAYIVLMRRVRLLKPLAYVIGLPFIRPLLARYYHYSVAKRLRRSGRYPQDHN